MAKIKKPARKGTASTAAPKKKAGKKKPNAKPRKPIPQQVIETAAAERALKRLAQSSKSALALSAALQSDESLALEPLPTPPPAPRYPAPPQQSAKSKFWRQYQDTTTGAFIGWAEAIKRTVGGVISRLRLRKPGAAKK